MLYVYRCGVQYIVNKNIIIYSTYAYYTYLGIILLFYFFIFFSIIFLTGLVGKTLKYITPLTVVPTVCIIGLSVIEKGMILMSGNWMTSIMYLFLIIHTQYIFIGSCSSRLTKYTNCFPFLS